MLVYRALLFSAAILLFAPVALAQDAGADAEEDAGEKLTHPGWGEQNKRLIEEYTADHGCRCDAVGTPHNLHGWLPGLALALASAVYVRVQRRRKPGAGSPDC